MQLRIYQFGLKDFSQHYFLTMTAHDSFRDSMRPHASQLFHLLSEKDIAIRHRIKVSSLKSTFSIIVRASIALLSSCEENIDKSADFKKSNKDISSSFSVIEETSNEGNGEDGFQVILGRSMLTIPAGSVSSQVRLKATIKKVSSDDAVILSGNKDAYAVEIIDVDTQQAFAHTSILKPFLVTADVSGNDKNDLMIRKYDGNGSYFSESEIKDAQLSLIEGSVIQFQIPNHAPTAFVYWFGDADEQANGLSRETFAALEADEEEATILKNARKTVATSSTVSTTTTTTGNGQSDSSAQGLVLHLKFDEHSLNTLSDNRDFADSGPYSIHGHVYQNESMLVGTGELGKKGKAILFADVVSDHAKRVIVPHHAGIAFSEPNASLSVLMWFKTSSGNLNNFYSLFDKRTTDSAHRGFHAFLDSGKIKFQINDQQWTNRGPYGNNVHDGSWHHFAMVYDGVSDIAKIAIDGAWITPLEGVDVGPISNIGNTNQLEIGGHSDFYYGEFVGTMDDFAIFNRALTLDEINAFAN